MGVCNCLHRNSFVETLYCIMRNFIRVFTVYSDKVDPQNKKCNKKIIITCYPLIYTMDHLDFILCPRCSFMENTSGLNRVSNFNIFTQIKSIFGDRNTIIFY